MSIIWTIIIGFVAGLIAKWIMPGRNEPSGFIMTTILGIVGAGGVGFEVQAAFSQFLFHRVLTILIEIVIMVTVVDRLSAFVRARLI